MSKKIQVMAHTSFLGHTGYNNHSKNFFTNLRSLHPRARLMCMFDRISRQTEKDMRRAGLLFLGSYEHFDECYDSVLEKALWPQKANEHQPHEISNKPLKAQGDTQGIGDKKT